MSQKVIPISLRLYKKKNWDSKWITEKNNYSNLLHFDLEIKQYFKNIFNFKEFKLIQIKIIKISNNINIYVYFCKTYNRKKLKLTLNKILNNLNLYYKYNKIKIFIKKIKIKKFNSDKKKILYLLKRNIKYNKDIRSMVFIFGYAIYTKKINVISNFIKQYLEKKKHHKKIIKQFTGLLNEFYRLFSNFLGFNIQFKGRLNGKKRKNKIIIKKGKIPLNTLKYDIKYDLIHFKTPSGICSIKILMFFKKTSINKKCYPQKKQNIKKLLKVN